MPLFEHVGSPRYSRRSQRKGPVMTAFRNHSSAGDSTRSSSRGRVFAAAVWEPSGFNEGTAAERKIRTLRPCPRTQGRVAVGSADEPGDHHMGHETRPWETGLTYLLGALLGLAVVSASLVGAGEEVPVPTYPTLVERPAVP